MLSVHGNNTNNCLYWKTSQTYACTSTSYSKLEAIWFCMNSVFCMRRNKMIKEMPEDVVTQWRSSSSIRFSFSVCDRRKCHCTTLIIIIIIVIDGVCVFRLPTFRLQSIRLWMLMPHYRYQFVLPTSITLMWIL